MGGGIEVEGVHQVLLSLNGGGGHEVDVLVPMGAAHQDDVVGVVLANFVNLHYGIFFERFPGVVDGFVKELVDDVGVFAVFLGEVAKPLAGFLGVHLVGVPVHDDIDALLDGGLDHGLDALLGEFGILQVVVFNLDAHGNAHHRGIPLGGELLHGSFVVEAGPDVVPTEGDAAQDDGLSVLVAELCSDDLQLSVPLDGCLGSGIQREG